MFKKAIALPLLAGLALPVLADDAKVLPEGVLRTTIAPSFTTIDKEFDSSGDRQDPQFGTITVNTLSIALEYGINEWVTAGLQWAPGYAWSGEVEDNEAVDLSGANDLFVGAKLQILGTNGLSQSDNMRFAVTPGIKIPVSQYDADEELANFMAVMGGGDETFRPGRSDRGAWGLGARFSFDYLITPDFFINFYNQTSIFLDTEQDYSPGVADADVEYGPEFIFEVEPNYSTVVGNGIQISMGLPVRYTTTGETVVNGNTEEDEKWKLELAPSVGFFFTQSPLPVELKLSYTTALAGENELASNTVAFQIRNFFRF
ncbi:MAG: hypothetical protein LAT65_12085 [Saccharospirillum sp.]|nr:hypothetical protein [Saccharospirillum sp.]